MKLESFEKIGGQLISNYFLKLAHNPSERGLDEAEALSMNTLTKQSLLTNKNNHKITIPNNVVMVDEMQNCMKKWESNTVDDAEVKNDRKTN